MSGDRRPTAFVVWGSLGDLHPFLAIARELKSLGLDTIIATHEEYRAKVEAEGLGFFAMAPSFADLEAEFGTDRAGITRALLRDPLALFTRAIFPFLDASIRDTGRLLDETPWLVLCSPAIGSRLAAQGRGLGWLSVVLQPMQFLSAIDPPVLMPGAFLHPLQRRFGPRFSRVLYALIGARLRRLAKPVTLARARWGLAPDPREPLLAGQFGAHGTLALYSAHFAPLQADYPPDITQTGFAHYDSEHGGAPVLDGELERFLLAGEPPLVFTLGSAFVQAPGAFFEVSAEAARRLGRRAVLLVGPEGLPAHTRLASAHVHVAAYAPYSLLFPRAAVVVHQGGIGTLGQGLRAGRPQLVVPHFGDQADNAARAVRLGVALSLRRRAYKNRNVLDTLHKLVDNPSYAQAAAKVSQRLATENGARAGAEAIARWRGL